MRLLSPLIKIKKKLEWESRYTSRRKRVLPNFLIIGAQKGGTSSLYKNLAKHPKVAKAFHKEPHFFDFNYEKGLDWYKAFFPSKIELGDKITGEATPYYIFHPDVPRRVFNDLPKTKLIVMLRNPVKRAFSHYNKDSLKGKDPLPFLEAINSEEERLTGEIESNTDPFNQKYHWKHSYLSRGRYAEQLKRWFNVFSRNQILVIQSEKYFTDTKNVFKMVQDFLELPYWDPGAISKHNVGKYSKMDKTTEKALTNYFKPYNEHLYKLIGERYDW